MAVKTIQIADKPTLDATKALLEDSEVGLAAIKQAASSGAVSGSAGGLHVEKAINISPSMDISISTLPYNFYKGSAVVANDKIYIIGSYDSSYCKKFYEYDGTSWNEKEAIPYDFYDGAAVAWNDEIYIVGARNGSYCEICYYDPKSLAWYTSATMSYGFYRGSVVIWNDEMHILGGANNNTYHRKFKGGNMWSDVSTLPYDFYEGSAVVWNGELHILGGSGGKTKHYKYDGSSWSEVSTLPYEFYEGSAVVWNDEIHILGGSGDSLRHYKYDGSSWSEVSTLPYRFYQGSAVVWNDELHILGGFYTSSGLTSHYSVKGDAHYVAVMLPKGTHILLPDNEEITYINNAVKVTNNVAEVSETGCVEILAKYLEPGNIKDFLTFY